MKIPQEWSNFYVGREVKRNGVKGVVKSFTMKWGHVDAEVARSQGLAIERVYKVEWSDKTYTHETDVVLAENATQRFVEEPWVSNVVLYLQKHNWEGYAEDVAVLKERADAHQKQLLKDRQTKFKNLAKKGTVSAAVNKQPAQGGKAGRSKLQTKVDKQNGAAGNRRKIIDLSERLAKRNAERHSPGKSAAQSIGGTTKAAAAAQVVLSPSPTPAANDDQDRGASNSLGGRQIPCLSQPVVTSPVASSGVPATAHLSDRKLAATEPQAQVLSADVSGVRSGCKRKLALEADWRQQAAPASSSKQPAAVCDAGHDLSSRGGMHAAATMQATQVVVDLDVVDSDDLDLAQSPAVLGHQFKCAQSSGRDFFQVGASPSKPRTAPGCRPDEIAEPLWQDRSYTYSQLDGHVFYKYNLRAGPDRRLWRIYSRGVIVLDEHCYNPAKDMLCRKWKLEDQAHEEWSAVQEDAEYTVERVVGEREHPTAGKQYLIKWQEYELDLADDNWLSASDLNKARAVFKDWNSKLKQHVHEAATFFSS